MPTLRRCCPLALVLLVAAAACGGGDSGTEPEPGPRPIDVTGSWLSVNVNQGGVPSSRYDLVQQGNTLTGEAFWEYDGALERVGPISGTIDADGNAQWVTTLNDNGWDGRETVDARFTGVEVVTSAPIGLGPVASSAATPQVNGTWEWLSPAGQRREGGSFRLERPEIVFLPQGTGSLGAAGPWRGAMFYNSAGGCHTTGFVMAMTLSVQGGQVVGTVSASAHPRGGALPTKPEEFLGTLRSEATGTLVPADQGATLSLALAGEVTGQLVGDLITRDTHTQYLGTFQFAKPCRDGRGEVHSGYFVFNSERPVTF